MRSKRAYGTGGLFERDGKWVGRWRTVDGRRPQKIVGPAGRSGMSKREAEAKLQELIRADANPKPAQSELTVSDFSDQLVRRLQAHGRKRSTLESVRGHLRAHINPQLGHLPIVQVDERDVARLIDAMIAGGKSPKTVRNVIGTLHSVFALAIRERAIVQNPAELADLPEPRRGHELRYLTQPELERVLDAPPKLDAPRAERDWWPVLRLLVLTAAHTGMRLGELRALRWSDLDFGAMKVRVHQSYVRGEYGTPKSRRSARAIPLASRLVSELEEHHRSTVWNQDTDLVLAHPHTGRPLDRVRLLAYFKDALRRADVRVVRLHDMRHTFATTVAASGTVSLRTLQEWMGHENARTTEIYADYVPGSREAELLDSAFGSPVRELETEETR